MQSKFSNTPMNEGVSDLNSRGIESQVFSSIAAQWLAVMANVGATSLVTLNGMRILRKS